MSYTGRALARIAEAEQIRSFAGNTPPDGHQVLGVVTARCETINESAGVLAGRCNEANMRQAAAQRAAEVGGSGLLEVDCRNDMIGREFTRQDAGLSKVDVRHRISCRATVVRGPLANTALASADGGVAEVGGSDTARELDIDGVLVQINVTRAAGAPHFAPRPADSVGEVEAASGAVVRLAEVRARCVAGCARRTAIRALRQQAADLGALVIAAVQCDLEGDRWSCRATALQEAADAGAG